MNEYSTSNIIYRRKFIKIILFPSIKLVDCGLVWNSFYVVTLYKIYVTFHIIKYFRVDFFC
jgi:hypothetical protein